MRKIITVIAAILIVYSCKSTADTRDDQHKIAKVNIVNSTNHQIFEVYFQDDNMSDYGKNLITMVIEAGQSRSFVLDPGRYKMQVVFVVNDVKIPVQYNDLLLPGYEYAWEITEENVDLLKTGSYEGYIFDLGTDSAPEEQPEDLTEPEETGEETLPEG
jgi:hypothetical protein